MSDRLDAQLAFLDEAHRLKSVLRASTLLDRSRRENSAEHSWHIALYALILAEHANRPVAIDRVIRMLLLHDLVEIDAGDTPIHGAHDAAAKEAEEIAAANRLFAILPQDQGAELRALWDEFEAGESDDAIFARAVDRAQPCHGNLVTGGGSWLEYDVTEAQLETRVGRKVKRGAPALWAHIQRRVHAWFLDNK
ncbi:MAG: HD domain-containing protein [Rhodobacteraceae bacterium]|nr:HD domain-containing protein [Paracoccaceae bacterium]